MKRLTVEQKKMLAKRLLRAVAALSEPGQASGSVNDYGGVTLVLSGHTLTLDGELQVLGVRKVADVNRPHPPRGDQVPVGVLGDLPARCS